MSAMSPEGDKHLENKLQILYKFEIYSSALSSTKSFACQHTQLVAKRSICSKEKYSYKRCIKLISV